MCIEYGAKSKPKGASHFIPCPKQPFQSNNQNLVNDKNFNIKKTNALSNIIWGSIPIRPKLLSRVRRLLQKTIIQNCDNLRTLAIVRRVEKPKSWFLTIRLVKINGFSTFGHSGKHPSMAFFFALTLPPTNLAETKRLKELICVECQVDLLISPSTRVLQRLKEKVAVWCLRT
jgi:hypothetical protein